MNKLKLTQPAFPSMPLQDSLGRMIIPNAGLSRLEYFALKIYEVSYKKHHKEFLEDGNEKRLNDDIIMDIAIDDAIEFLEKIDKQTNYINDEKTNTSTIIQ
jgi:hypothetical protein